METGMKRLFCLIACVCLALALSLWAVATPALTAEDVADMVDRIDASADYATRLAYLESVNEAVASLDSEEFGKLTALTTEAIDAEEQALAELGEWAESFISEVGRMKDCIGLVEKESVADEILDGGILFEDATYPGVADALADYNEVRDRVDACNTFIDAISEASLIDVTEYAQVKEWLLVADENKNLIDATYPGVSDAVSSYNQISYAITQRENYTRSVINQILEIDLYEGYAMKRQCVTSVERAMNDEQYEDECDFVAEGLAKLEQVKIYFRDCIAKANEFITAVSALEGAEDLPTALLNALIAFDGVDSGVEGVGMSVQEFNNALKAYNSSVERINAINSAL